MNKNLSDQKLKDEIYTNYLIQEHIFQDKYKRAIRLGMWLDRLNEFHKIHAAKFTVAEYEFIFKPYQSNIWSEAEVRFQTKYSIRALNVYREMLRVDSLYPEIKKSKKKISILDLSSGACGNNEVLKYYGHKATSSEYFGGFAEFEGIYKELNIEPVLFDGTQKPYPFEDKSFDYVVCNQAINLYGMPRTYPKIINELKRITRTKLIVIYNNVFSAIYREHVTKMAQGVMAVQDQCGPVEEAIDTDRGLVTHIFQLES